MSDWSGHLSGAEPLYGAQTERALANFAVRGPRLRDYPALVRALAQVKAAAARANARLGALPADVADAVQAAAAEVAAGAHDDQFVLPFVQGGGGTSTHMNVNEVLAAVATRGLGRPVHPNDHVNRGQSTNDVVPTGTALAVRAAADGAAPGVARLVEALRDKASEYPRLEHLGRTCLQDAVALPVAAVHRAHAHGVEQAWRSVDRAAGDLLAVPLGATAVGTGIGAAPGFAAAAVAELAALTGFPVTRAADPFFALSSLEPLVAVAEAVDRCARSMARVAGDLRLLASGPVGGIGEVRLPPVQAGSSIMPGKVNPVMPELVLQHAFQTAGEAASARHAAAAGELEVTAMAPVVALALLAGLDRLGAVATLFAQRCVAGLRWDEDAVAANLAGSLSGAVEESTRDGYEHAARRVRERNGAGTP